MSSWLDRDQLRQMALFSQLEDADLDRLLDRHRGSISQPEQVIVMEQDWGESIFLLCSGLAKVRTYTSDGDEVVMSLLGRGDIFGEMVALDEAVRSADVVALTPLQLVKFRVAPFASLLKQNAQFAISLARLEASRLRDLNRRFALQSADATTRLLDSLAYIARKSSDDNSSETIIPALPQRELALLAGLARETASRTLSKLRRRGTIVEIDGNLKLVDLNPLRKRGLID